MVRHRGERIAARQAGADDVLERLAAVTPRRVHLQIAAIVRPLRAAQRGVGQHGSHSSAAEEVGAPLPPPDHVRGARAERDSVFNHR